MYCAWTDNENVSWDGVVLSTNKDVFFLCNNSVVGMSNYHYTTLILCLSTISCTFQSPEFELDDNCLRLDEGQSFKAVSISNESRDEHYLILRDRQYNGYNRICLSNIPRGYILKQGGNNLSERTISLLDGDTLIISHAGGDRFGYTMRCKYSMGRLIKI